ncbi:MAG: putative transporter ATP-binding protein YbhF [Planctomycetota bacterium]
MAILQTHQLTLSYGSRRGIQQVSLQIEAGRIFGFLGPNGAGKSTTIRVLTGLLKAHSGTAQIFGLDCWTQGALIRRDVGYVPGDVRLYPWLTLARGLDFLSQVRGRDLHRQGLELAERFALEPHLSVRKMSRGNRQKTALILAMAHQPRLLILDEPTSGLDPLMQDQLMQCLREQAQQGSTVLFSSHTLSEVEAICDRVAMIRQGKIVEDSTLAELQARAPRKIILTLPEDSPAPEPLPPNIEVLWQPTSDNAGRPSTADALLLAGIPPEQRPRTWVLQIRGPSKSFLQWAAAQPFSDVVLGPPSLDALFRRYYETDEPHETPPTETPAVEMPAVETPAVETPAGARS